MENPSQNQLDLGKNQAVRKPSIRTMKSDVEELFKNTRPSLLQLVEQGSLPPDAAPHEKTDVKKIIRISLISLAIVFGSIGGLLYIPKLFKNIVPATQKFIAPPALFAVENSRTVSVNSERPKELLMALEDSHNEPERKGTFKRIVVKVKDGPQERSMTTKDWLELMQITAPRNFLDRVGSNPMPFFYSSEKGARFGMAVETSDIDRTFADMLAWESSLLLEMRPLFFGFKPDLFATPFEDRTYRNIDWRFQKLSSTEDFGIGYTVFPASKILVITTSREGMETVINRLFGSN